MSAQRVIGVDLGGTKILAGVLTRDGAVERTLEAPTPTSSQDELVAGIEQAVSELVDGGIAALGFGIPSRIDQRRGIATGAVNIPLDDFPLRDGMRERFGLPTGIDNDGNAAALAEWKLGAGRGASDLVMLTLGTGVGGGIVLDGSLYRGWAELGHVVVDYGGAPCFGRCTGLGHLEALVSGQAADRDARALLGPDATAHDLVMRARAGDERSIETLAQIGRYLGAGIATFVNMFDPDLVVIGGGFGAAAADLLIPSAEEIVERDALTPANESTRIVLAELGVDAGLLGAGLIAFEALET